MSATRNYFAALIYIIYQWFSEWLISTPEVNWTIQGVDK